jgi:hypothetical protein
MKLIGNNQTKLPVSADDDVIAACPYVVRRGRQIVATFANKSDAGNWARAYSNYRDTGNTFIIHTASEILAGYRDGDEVEVP